MAYTDAGNDVGYLEYISTPKLNGYYHLGCEVNPLTKDLIQQLILNDVYDPKYTELHNGLRGLYEEQLEDDGNHAAARPITCMYVASLEGVPFGVVVARHTKHIPEVQHIVHVYVKPEWRRKGYARRLLTLMTRLMQVPGMAMQETDDNRRLLESFREIRPIRRPTPLDRELARCRRTLERKEKWTNEEGSLLCHEDILETLNAQAAEIERLRKLLNPNDNAITYPG